jgi:DNA polymerase-3 subunit gamma/tau
MTDQLTLKYRPQTFGDMVGQKLTAVVLDQMVSKDAMPNALLFDGPRGTGKTSAARIVAMELNPEERDSILAGTSLAILEIDAASHGSVADIRALSEQLRYSAGAKNRVVILDEAHSITREGFNALLKTLEEPPDNVTFILVTTEPHKLPETILSRLMEFEFRRVVPADLLERIRSIAELESIEIQDELLAKLSEVADGSVRDAIKNLDFVHRSGISTVDEYIKLTGEKDVGPVLFAALLTNDHSTIFTVFDHLMMETGDPRVISTALSDVITDLFILKSDGAVTASGKALDHRLKLAKLVDSQNLFAALQILWDLKTKVRWSEDQRAALSAALVLAADKLTDGKTPDSVNDDTDVSSPVPSEEEAPRVLTISEIQQS